MWFRYYQNYGIYNSLSDISRAILIITHGGSYIQEAIMINDNRLFKDSSLQTPQHFTIHAHLGNFFIQHDFTRNWELE